MKVKFKRLNENAVMPKKAHPTDAGFEGLMANIGQRYGTLLLRLQAHSTQAKESGNDDCTMVQPAEERNG